jgi:hypothetical protein
MKTKMKEKIPGLVEGPAERSLIMMVLKKIYLIPTGLMAT